MARKLLETPLPIFEKLVFFCCAAALVAVRRGNNWIFTYIWMNTDFINEEAAEFMGKYCK